MLHSFSKGEFVVEATLREASKFQVFNPAAGEDKLKVYQPLRTRIESFLFPPTGRTTWEQIKDGAASRGHLLWTEPGTFERMRETLISAGAWREEAGQIQKPPFDETTGVTIEYARDKETGTITTTDIKLAHADKLFVREDAGEWKPHPTDQALVSEAMLIEFKAVDSSGKNQEGKPYRIENTIDLSHDFVTSPNTGYKYVKVKVVPPTAKLLFTLDETNPANHGKTCGQNGIEAPEGTTVRLHAEKGSVVRSVNITVPKPDTSGTGGNGTSPYVNPDLPATVNGKAFAHLVTRPAVYHLLNSLPADARLQMVQAKITVAASDNTITLTWDRKTRLAPGQCLKAFAFLDTQIADGEWSLKFEQLHFPTGKALLQWQVDTSSKIAPSQVTQ